MEIVWFLTFGNSERRKIALSIPEMLCVLERDSGIVSLVKAISSTEVLKNKLLT